MQGGIIAGNKILDIVFLSMVIAQAIKIFSPILRGKKPQFSKIFETGGMPSSHSSSVTSLCVSLAMVYGTKTPEFTVAIVFSIIVMYDATGIRREAGKHAKVLNNIIFNSNLKVLDSKEFIQFKEFLGHTPLEVFGGIVLGSIIPLIFRGYLL